MLFLVFMEKRIFDMSEIPKSAHNLAVDNVKPAISEHAQEHSLHFSVAVLDIIVSVLFVTVSVEFLFFMGSRFSISGFVIYSSSPSAQANFILIIFLLMFTMLFALLAAEHSGAFGNFFQKFLKWFSAFVRKEKDA